MPISIRKQKARAAAALASAAAAAAAAAVEREAFAAQPAEDKILALYDMMLALRKDLQGLATRLDEELDRRPVASSEEW